MIYSTLQQEDLPKLIQYGMEVHRETRFATGEYNQKVFSKFLLMLSAHPTTYFFRYSKNSIGEVNGMFFGQVSPEYFSGKLVASDLGMFVRKDHRGSPVFLRMYNEFEKWAKTLGAYKIILYHSTGIEPEKTERLYKKLGYEKYGSLFDKEI